MVNKFHLPGWATLAGELSPKPSIRSFVRGLFKLSSVILRSLKVIEYAWLLASLRSI